MDALFGLIVCFYYFNDHEKTVIIPAALQALSKLEAPKVIMRSLPLFFGGV